MPHSSRARVTVLSLKTRLSLTGNMNVAVAKVLYYIFSKYRNFVTGNFSLTLSIFLMTVPRRYFFCGSFVFVVSCVSHAFASVHCCLTKSQNKRIVILSASLSNVAFTDLVTWKTYVFKKKAIISCCYTPSTTRLYFANLGPLTTTK